MSLGKRNVAKRKVQNRTCGTIRCVDEKYEGTNNRRAEKMEDCDFCECTMISTHVSKEKESFSKHRILVFPTKSICGFKIFSTKKDTDFDVSKSSNKI